MFGMFGTFGATPDPLAPTALRGSTIATLLVLVAALVGAGVRILPWMLDPSIPWATLWPFAKSLAAIAIETAILTGWPVGWAIAAARLVERGEARVLASLGEPASRTVARLAPQAGLFVAMLAITSVALGRDAAAPGRIVAALLAEGRGACASEPNEEPDGADRPSSPATHAVPFVAATWLCASPARGGPRLVGRAPLGGVVYTATNARVSDDLRRIDLEDARLALAHESRLSFQFHVASLTLRGLPPWAQASSIPPFVRALTVTTSGILASAAAALALLKLRRRRVGTVAAVGIGAVGPLAALGTLRALEVRAPEAGGSGHAGAAWLLLLVLVPIAGIAAVGAASALAALLPGSRRTGTK